MKTCFIVTSVIEPWTTKKLNYGDKRSAFSVEERYIQTIETIKSINTYAPDAHIMIVEAGKPTYNKRLQLQNCQVVSVR